MEARWVLIAVLVALLAFQVRQSDHFVTDTTHVSGRQSDKTSSRFDRNRLRACLAAAVDAKATTRPTTTVPVALADVTKLMRKGVAKINKRCGLDLYQVSVDGISQQVDSLGTKQYSSTVHVFSKNMNISAALQLSLLQPAASDELFIVEAATISNPSSGPEPAPADVFDHRFSKVETFDGLL